MCIFFFNDTATTEIYTLSLHDALPIFERSKGFNDAVAGKEGIEIVAQQSANFDQATAQQVMEQIIQSTGGDIDVVYTSARSEEHTSELQSRQYLVCRLLLEKKKHKTRT